MPERAKGETPGILSRDPRLFPLFASLRTLDGVGPSLMVALRRLLAMDEPRIIDLLLQPPLAERQLDALEDVALFTDGAKVTLSVQIGDHLPPRQRAKGPYKVVASTGSETLDLIFFHARGNYVADNFPSESSRLIHGRLGNYRGRWQMAHPELLPDDPLERQRASLVYGLSEGLTQLKLKKLIEQALEKIPDLPEWHEGQASLPAFKPALSALHGFDNSVDRQRARARLALDELLATQIALQSARHTTSSNAGRATNATGILCKRMMEGLSFAPTQAQDRAVADIRSDMQSSRQMLRLLMGDVGSGKTLVAIAAMLDVVECGKQALLMAPTEILARQHANSISLHVAAMNVRIGLLTASDPTSVRRDVKASLADGSLDIAVGTHALFQDDVEIADLALAVIDEQHRFGVNQRMSLVRKGAGVDLLLMTATPIPRSLVLAHYGDIDVSRLREKPSGRQPIRTVVLASERLGDVMDAIGRAMTAGERAYWVCPAIDDALDENTPTAEDRFEMLFARFGERVAIVHGRLKAGEKAAAMQRFASGDATLLVATTVIEVGVDVPEATVIVIDGAEHFGLAQLHQLRGRVGRGDKPSTAMLIYTPPVSKMARERLKTMRETDDGFKIADQDLRLRGPGEILGNRQSGFAKLRFVDMAQDEELIEVARVRARQLLSDDPQMKTTAGRSVRLLQQIFDSPSDRRFLDAG